jgi:hypothetical protein
MLLNLSYYKLTCHFFLHITFSDTHKDMHLILTLKLGVIANDLYYELRSLFGQEGCI